HCPGVTVLATSREPLGVPGETVRPVEPLPPAPAHQLFAERAATVRPGFDPAADPDTAAAVAEICRRLDGLPLAIELAAARLRLLTPRQIADRLDDRFRLLTSGSRTALPRQQTLRAVVEWSWDLLDERERTVLRRASVFAGGWTLSAAEAVCADAPPGASALTNGTDGTDGTDADGVIEDGVGIRDVLTDATASTPEPGDTVAYAETRAPTRSYTRPQVRIAPAEVLELLGALVDKSLLIVDHPSHDAAAEPSGPAGGEPRYRMLETINEYVGERATEDGAARADHKAAVARHTAHFRDFIRTAEPRLRSAGQLPWLRLVENDLDNIRAALHRSLTTADESTVFALIRDLAWFWWLRNYRQEGLEWLGRVLRLGVALDTGSGRATGGGQPEPPDPVDHFLAAPDGEAGHPLHALRMDLRMLHLFLLTESAPMDVFVAERRPYVERVWAHYAGGGPRAARLPG
ncbi:ATP-binding protein, partial [Streptomyces rubiginosohelvolus]